MQEIIAAFKKYAVFSGRSTRKEYWMFIGLETILEIFFAFLGDSMSGVLEGLFFSIFGLLFLALILPTISVSVRRMHDTGRSGWWVLVQLIPYLGTLIFLVLALFKSQPGENQYGPNPYEQAEALNKQA